MDSAFTLPPLPEGWKAEKDVKIIGQLSTAIKRNIEPVGRHFLAHARRVTQIPFHDDRTRASCDIRIGLADEEGENPKTKIIYVYII